MTAAVWQISNIAHKIRGIPAPPRPSRDKITDMTANPSTVNLNARDEYRSTPLHKAATGDVAEILIRRGAKINVKNRRGFEPIHGAANKEVAEVLIRNGADVNAKNDYGETPLHWATDSDVAELLIRHGARVGATEKMFGSEPLHWAVRALNYDVAKTLILHKAYVDPIDGFGDTPLKIAYFNESENLANLLLSHGAIDIGQDDDDEEAWEYDNSIPESHARRYRAIRELRNAHRCICSDTKGTVYDKAETRIANLSPYLREAYGHNSFSLG